MEAALRIREETWDQAEHHGEQRLEECATRDHTLEQPQPRANCQGQDANQHAEHRERVRTERGERVLGIPIPGFAGARVHGATHHVAGVDECEPTTRTLDGAGQGHVLNHARAHARVPADALIRLAPKRQQLPVCGDRHGKHGCRHEHKRQEGQEAPLLQGLHQPGQRITADLLRPGAQSIGIRGVKGIHQMLERLRAPIRVCIREHEQFTGGRPGQLRTGVRFAQPAFWQGATLKRHDPRIAFGVRSDHLQRAIGGLIVQHQDLEVGVRLRTQAGQQACQVPGFVAGRNQH